jgi:hypothetical protein
MLLMGCLTNAHIVATHQRIQPDKQDNGDTTYCLITQLGNHLTQVKFLRGIHALREETLQQFKCYLFKNFVILSSVAYSKRSFSTWCSH